MRGPAADRPVDDLRVVLDDGRRVAVACYGPSDGTPVLYLHGIPGSRLEPLAFGLHHQADRARVRLIAADRPGIGRSDADPGLSPASYPQHVVRLLDRLGIGEVSLLAFAGGVPCALRTAEALGTRIRTTALVSCPAAAAQAAPDDAATGCATPEALAARLSARGPRRRASRLALLARWAPRAGVRRLCATLPPVDLESLERDDVLQPLAASLREAFRQGCAGPDRDLALATAPAASGPPMLTGRVTIWQGVYDPDGVAAALAVRDRAVRSQLHLLPEGRLSLLRHHGASVLADIARFAATAGVHDDLHR